MRHVIDITGDNFSKIDFTEATIVDFYCKNKLPSSFEFSVYGATLLMDPRWEHKEPFTAPLQKNEDMYVAGMGIIKLSGFVGGSLDVGISENSRDIYGASVWARNGDGSIVTCRKEWESGEIQNVVAYLWECGIAWPRGSCCLNLYLQGGSMTYEFDDNDLITAETYCSREGEAYYFKSYS